MAWYWVASIVSSTFILLSVGSVYWFGVRPELRLDFKMIFGVFPEDKNALTVVENKLRELYKRWEHGKVEFYLLGKNDKLKEAEKDYERAERLAHRFKIAGW